MLESNGSRDHFQILPLLFLTICLLPLWRILRTPRSPRGCRRLGLPRHQSNLTDEFDPKFSAGHPSTSQGTVPWRVKALFTYPVKSCRGIELQTAEVVSTGLKYDRQFVFAEQTAGGWTCRTLRNAGYNRLARVQPEIWVPDPSKPDYDPSLPEILSQGVLVISYPRYIPTGLLGILARTGIALNLLSPREAFTVPLTPSKDQNTPLVPVKIWKDTLQAHNYGHFLPPTFHKYMSHNPNHPKLTLLSASPFHTRDIYRNAPRKSKLGFQPTTTFADAYPIHLLNLSSHADVATKCTQTLPNLSIRRFRGNIIITGPAPFTEDGWKRILIGGVEIHVACRTVRCKLPNVDPDSGVRHGAEPEATLKGYRRIDEGAPGYACLGMQLVPAVEAFEVSVGDEVSVLEVGEHRYIKLLEAGERVEGV